MKHVGFKTFNYSPVKGGGPGFGSIIIGLIIIALIALGLYLLRIGKKGNNTVGEGSQ